MIEVMKPNLCKIMQYENEWMRVKDFIENSFLKKPIQELEKLCKSNFSITLLDYRAIEEFSNIKRNGLCNPPCEFLVNLLSFGELINFIEDINERNYSYGIRFPNTKMEKLDYYVYCIEFIHYKKVLKSELYQYLPLENDSWRLFGEDDEDSVRIAQISPTCIFKNSNSLFCFEDDLNKEENKNA